MLEEAFQRMPRAEIFSNTGIQFMQLNTLYQLLAMSVQKSQLFDIAKSFVTIPDLFNYWSIYAMEAMKEGLTEGHFSI